MKASLIICEYNPFHNGHKYLNEKVKENSDAIVSVMSGSFTQRGDIAVMSKYKRAKAALLNGADLVVELPTVYACANAERFSKAGVQIASALGCINELCFASESGNIEDIIKTSKAVENKKVKDNTLKLMEKGEYYPKALEISVEKYFGKEVSNIINQPNNILGVEYCKALKDTNIKPKTFLRKGVEHDSKEVKGNIASASYIRSILKDQSDKALNYVSENTFSFFNNLAFIENLEIAILYKLRTMTAEDFKKIPDVGQGLENRIYSVIKNSTSIEEVLKNIKTKRYPLSRIRRIIIHAILGITEELQNTNVPYLRILGFTKKGERILSSAKKKDELPIITKVSSGYRALKGKDKEIFNIDLKASNIFGLATRKRQKCGSDFYSKIIKV